MGHWGQLMGRNVLSVLIATSISVGLGATAMAQGKAKPAKKGSEVAWVKVCKESVVTQLPKDKKSKPTQQKKMICRTRYEQLAPFAAMSVQVQEIKGVKELGLIMSFSLPQQMAIKPGILAAVYTAAQWAKVQKKQSIDKKELKILKVGYTRCGPGSCNAEVPAPEQLIADMGKGAVMLVKAFRGDGQVVEVPVSLAGFTKVLKGKPTDFQAYQQARAKALKALGVRRNQILKQERERRENKGAPKQPAKK